MTPLAYSHGHHAPSPMHFSQGPPPSILNHPLPANPIPGLPAKPIVAPAIAVDREARGRPMGGSQRKPPASMLKARHHGSGELLLAEPAVDRDRERDRDRDRDRSRDRDRDRDWNPSKGDSYVPSRDVKSSKISSGLSSFRARDGRDRGRDRDRGWDSRRDAERRELARDRWQSGAFADGGSPMQISRSPSPVVPRAHRNKRREEVAEKLAANGMDYLKIEGLRLGKEEGEKGVREVLGEFNIDQVRSFVALALALPDWE